MQTDSSHHESSSAGRGRPRAGRRSAALTWSVTFLLLALVSAIFAFGGTAGESGGQWIRAATIGFLVLAATVFTIFRNH